VTPVLLAVTVTEDVAEDAWWVHATFDVAGHPQFVAQWPFPTRGEADAFADDRGVVEAAGQMALDAWLADEQ
jgi:hypothetical protein